MQGISLTKHGGGNIHKMADDIGWHFTEKILADRIKYMFKSHILI